ncbi:MAG: alpha/beta fold hydrolase [Vicinamibacterales bacterium]
MRTSLLILSTLLVLSTRVAAQVTTGMTDVVLSDRSVVHVESGQLIVPESRQRPSARTISIPFYRLRTTASSPGAPIFLLAGGPGSSWLDQFEAPETYEEARFYQSIADVVLFDQRGSGRSTPTLTCGDSAPLPPPDAPLDPAVLRETMRTLAGQCRDRWVARGVDLAAYNTVENAADVNDLRLALGYGKVTLVGGSYGSHLALQIVRQHPDAVERVVIFGVEGPDHTWDSPSGALHTLERIAAATEQAPAFNGRIPSGGLISAFARAVARLDATPQMMTVTTPTGSRRVRVDGVRLRRLLRADAGRRNAAWIWPERILAIDSGDLTGVAERLAAQRTLTLPDPVHFSMDCASGASAARRAASANDPATSLLGDINFEYDAICPVWPHEVSR